MKTAAMSKPGREGTRTLVRTRRRRLVVPLFLAAVLAAACAPATTASPAAESESVVRVPRTTANAVGDIDSRGNEYWLAFPRNYQETPELTLFITGDAATTGTVEIPGLAFSEAFSVTPGAVSSVVLPSTAQISSSDVVEDLGVHVTAGTDIAVYGLNRIQFTTDAFLGLPVDILGTSHVVLGYQNTLAGTEFAVVAPQDATTVTITPTVTTGARTAGVPYDVVLNAGQTYQLVNGAADPADLSGTIITSDKPVAVFGGHSCVNIPNGSTFACDHIVEQLPPTETWGKSFVTMPLATRVGGDTFRIMASEADTVVSINGAVVATLGAAEFHQQLIDGPATITADKPVLVAQYSNGSTFDGVTSDPFMMLIPPFEQFLASYTVTTPATGFAVNYINAVAPTGSVGSVTLDGTPIPAGDFVAIGTSGFSGAQVAVAAGSHTLAGPLPFGVFMYGFDSFDSYGYPGGLSLAPIARVTTVALAPETANKVVGEEHCVTATVTDQNNAPLEGIRVDFAVTGANPSSGFANTSAGGTAEYCYTGANPGDDSIEASVGTLTDTSTATWTEEANEPPVANDQAVSTPQDTPVAVTLTATDPEAQPLTYAVVGPPAHGTLSGTAPDLTYTPDAGYVGPDAFTFTADDGTSTSNTATVSITVEGAWAKCNGLGLTNYTKKRIGGITFVFGTNGDDVMYGTPGHDVILGGRGNDTLCGLGGHDIIDGGSGDDYLEGGEGKDLLIGGRGRDRCVADRWDITISCSGRHDHD